MKSSLIARCTAVLLVIAVSFVNVPLSFAAFSSDSTKTFTASVTIPGGGDSDYDGIPDAYDLAPNDPENIYNDDDNDGLTDLEEYRMGTDPTQPNNAMRATLTAAPSSGLQPVNVIFTASLIGGAPVKYEWDFDGNGTYDVWSYAWEGNAAAYKYTASGTYNAKLRVTDSAGNTAVAATTISVARNNALSPPTASPELNLAYLDVPMRLQLKATASDNVKITNYEWDTTGNGEYDMSLSGSADIVKTYNETLTRSFNASLKVTDTDGLSDIATVGISIDASSWNGSPYRPKVSLGNYIIYATASVPVTLAGYGSPEIGYAKKLEWDFEGDGIYDWSSTIDNADWTGRADVTHIYGAPGIYRAVLKVHTEANVSATNSALIIVSSSGAPPTASATVSYETASNATAINGIVPVKATFNHSSSSGSIAKYEWDFDGDKRIDYTTTSAVSIPTYDYKFPGYCVAMLRVTDVNGLTDTFYIPVFAVYPVSYASNITMPQEGKTVAGNAITLVSNVFPDDTGVSTVMFQYKKETDAAWTNIGLGTPVMSYTASWDTTALENGTTYQLRAIVNGQDSSSFKVTSVTVDNATLHPDIYEYSNGTHTKQVVVDPDEANNIVMPDGTHIEIPAGSLPEGQTQVVTVEEVFDKTAGVGGSVDISITGADKFLKDMIITIPYPDADNNGIIDGTDIDENTLVVKWYNPSTGEWEPLYDSVVYPDENFVSARINHLSLFSAGSIVFGAAVASGGGGSSAALGGVSYCFIATAAYGTPMADDVVVLRKFRDEYLIRHNFGRKFVWYYYRYSPPIAKFISNKPVLKAITRFLLKPAVRIAKEKVK